VQPTLPRAAPPAMFFVNRIACLFISNNR